MIYNKSSVWTAYIYTHTLDSFHSTDLPVLLFYVR